jgi:H+-transporting ATPase
MDTIPDPPESGLSTAEANRLLEIHGYNELASKEATPIWDFLKNFWGPMPIMIWIAIIVELIPKPEADYSTRPSWADFAVLLTLQIVNGLVGWYEHQKAGDAVAALKNSLSPKANVKRNGQWLSIPGRELVPGDLVSLAIGGAVPADCRVLGPKYIYCDQAALTGESLPVKIDINESAKMGSTVATGECDAVVIGTGDTTFFGKTAKLIAGVEEIGHFEKILYKITAFLLLLSLLLTGIIMGVLIYQKVAFLEVLAICVVLLVASIPIAMNVVCTSTMAIGSRKLALGGAIVTRLGSIEELAGMDMLCSDKTGTLTLGKMQMKDILVYETGMQKRDILKFSALAAKWYEPAKDAIDRLVLGDVEKTDGLIDELNTYEQLDYTPFDPATKKTASIVKNKAGKTMEVSKGAPQVILGLCINCDSTVKKTVEAKIDELAERGIRSLGIARKLDDDDQGWVWLGILTFTDPPRHDTKDTIEKAYALGIDVKMITGDQVAIAKETCFQLGMGTNIQGTELIPGDGNTDETVAYRFEEIIEELNGFAEVFPEHKYKIVQTFRKIGYRCGMTGDGVNDAPALKRADIGIAVEGATDAARAAADIVLTEPGLGVIIDAIYISRKIFKRMKNYVTYRIACTIQLLLFFFVAVLAIQPDASFICLSSKVSLTAGQPAVHYNSSICRPDTAKWAFNLPDVNALHDCVRSKEDYLQFCKCPIKNSNPPAFNIGLPGDDCNPTYFKIPVIALVLITILNDGTIISIAYDNVKPSALPEQWNLIRVCITSLILGVIACASTLILLFLGMQSGSENHDYLYSWFELPPLSLKQLECMIYLKISLSDFLTVFSARTQGFFFTQAPGKLLVIAFIAATTASTIFAATWPFGDMEPIGARYIMFVWIYCVVFFLIQDIFKVIANSTMDTAFEVTSNSAKRTKKKIMRANRKKLDREGRAHGQSTAGYKSSTSSGPSGFDKMDMATALNRINELTSELEGLKSVVMRHSGMQPDTESKKSSSDGTPNRIRNRLNKSLLSQKSRDASAASRHRSESKNW